MDSSTRRADDEKQRQEKIRAQIAELQAQLKEIPPALINIPQLASPKRKRTTSATLVPSTPSPKKKRRANRAPGAVLAKHVTERGPHGSSIASTSKQQDPQFAKPPASKLLQNLARVNKSGDSDRNIVIARSSGFTERPPLTQSAHDDRAFDQLSASKRDETLALVEDLEPGPVDHVPPADDPHFEKLEPNSCIRLSSRAVSHEDLQDHLRGRYYLSPSQLYSSIRLLPNKLGYDVPVPGDWITIAVVAERGPLRYSKAPVAMHREEGDEPEKKYSMKGKEKAVDEPPKPTGKKYVNIKLVDFGTRSRSSSSATGGKAVIRGDAFLSLLLFESDSFDLVTDEGSSKPRKVYKGGSRGAFESMAKLKEGDVVAILNPRVLKPYQRSNDTPHPVTNVLAVTPESASSIMTIGRARDLGMCMVLKKDNKPCGSWVDKRVSEVCEYHIQHAVERRRAARPEFSIGTTGMSTSSGPKRKPAYDPARQWGLKPEIPPDGATYIVSGHVVNDSGLDARSLHSTENIGREGQAKAARKLSAKDTDRALQSLLKRDRDGMKAVMTAREVGKSNCGKSKVSGAGERIKSKEAGREDAMTKADKGDGGAAMMSTKNAYSAEAIRRIGFDPIAAAGHRRDTTGTDMQVKLRTLEALQSSRKEIVLGPRPGERIRSGVVVPVSEQKREEMVDLDE